MANGIVANSIVNALAGFMLLVTGFASAIITARLLGPEANGIIAFSLWLVVSGASIAELGSSVMLLKMVPQLKAEGYSEHRRKGFAAILITPTLYATFALLALYAAFFLTSERFHWASTAPSVALVTGGLFVIQAIGSFSKFYLIGEKRLGSFFKLTVLVSLVQMAGVLLGAIYYGVAGALVGYGLGQLVLFIATLPIIFSHRDWCDVPKSYLTSSSIFISLEFIVEAIFLNRIELLFLQQFWSVKMVGFYAVGLSIANMALQVPIQLTGSLLPYYSERRHESGGGKLSADVIAGVTRSLSYITLPMSIGLAAISQELVVSVFGEPFRAAGPMVALLALAAPGAAFMQTLSLYLLSQDRAKERLWIGLFAAFAMVAGCLALVPVLGGEGAALTRIFVFVAMCVAAIKLLSFGRAFNSLYLSLVKVALASCACGLAAMGVLALQGGAVGLVTAIVAGAVVYIPALRLFRAVPPEDAGMMRLYADRLPGRFRRLGLAIVRFIAPHAELTDIQASAADAAPGDAAPVGAGREAALPVVFAGTIGHFLPEDPGVQKKDVAVLLLSPWGYDEMCVRKSFRILAERYAAMGIASLRFDYPGTGDAVDGTDFSAGLAVWEQSVLEAAERLKALSHCQRIVLVGQGIGATLAHRVGSRVPGVEAIAMLAPVLSGRLYLREVAFRAKFIYEDLGLSDAERDMDGVSVAGLRMPETIAAEIKTLSLAGAQTPAAGRYLVIERPVKAGDTGFVDALIAAGADARQTEYTGYDDLMTMPLTAREPVEMMETLIGWTAEIAAPAADGSASQPLAVDQVLQGQGFYEHPVRFGVHRNLVGVVCLPEGACSGASVLLLTTAYDRHSGWGGTVVNLARQLARAGIASMRYDSANIADSPPHPAAPDRVLYNDFQNHDAIAALDVLESHQPGSLMVAGRCSGGYVAFRTGLVDKRLSAVLAVNPFVFYWNPLEKVPEDISVVPRSLEDYGKRFARFETAKRLFTGQVNIKAALRNMVVATSRRLSFRIAPLLMHLPGRRTVAREVKRSFTHYQQNSIPLTVMYSERDVGLEHLYFHFGANGEKLKRYDNVELIMMPETDHNLTPLRARQRLFEEILKLARRTP